MFSRIVRRIHMYLALFLSPWVLIYALSTMAMNHREHLRSSTGEVPPVFRVESERPYNISLASGAPPGEAALQILRDIDMEGAHNASNRTGKLIINRFHPVHPKRITYDPGGQKLVIETMEFHTPAYLERMHRRRGFQSEYAKEDTWAFCVDLFIAAMVFWAASGLWMWWEMKVTRALGALFALAGLAVFAFFLVTI